MLWSSIRYGSGHIVCPASELNFNDAECLKVLIPRVDMNIRKIGLLGAVLLSSGVVPAYAVDTWSTTKGVLNMPLVQYGSKTYQNVTAVLGGVISVGSTCSSTSTAADTLSSTTGQLSIPAVTVTTTSGSTTYCNASVWLSSITSVGGVCADAPLARSTSLRCPMPALCQEVTHLL